MCPQKIDHDGRQRAELLADISTQHGIELPHHVHQGIAWLTVSAEGVNTAALSYAALEFRFAIERLAVQYWRVLLNRTLEERDLRDIGSFKRIENRIYELAGHQAEIDRHFEFMRIVLGALKIVVSFHTPKIGELSRHWHNCSELCHVGWPLASSVPEVRKGAFATLTETSILLSTLVSSCGWPVFQDTAFAELRARFIAGQVSCNDVLAYVQRTGIWASAEFPDGRPAQFVGEPVAPSAAE